MKPLSTRLSTLGLALGLWSAAGPGWAQSPVYEGSAPTDPAAVTPAEQYGVVQSITGQPGADGPRIGTGAILGGVVGALAGRHLAGRGDDKMVATALGALGGAFIGHQIEKHRDAKVASQVQVRMDDGSLRGFPADQARGLRVGDRVRVVGQTVWREAGGASAPALEDAAPPRPGDAATRPPVYNGDST